MHYDREDSIQVQSKGTAETDFVSATFKASAVTSGKTGGEAKAKCQPIIEKIRSAILAHAEVAKLDTSKMKTTFGVDIETNRHDGLFVGYRATYTISFDGRNVKAAPEVHDSLTSIEGVQSPTPVYNVSESAEIHAAAFRDAVEKAQDKFTGQCTALDLNPDHFRVAYWTVQDELPRGKTLSYAAAAEAKPIGLEPGKASLDLNVTLVFTRKHWHLVG